MTPRTLFSRVATAEAVTWTLLVVGMFLKYVTKTTELGVRIGGALHGFVFLTYVLVTLVVGVNQRWRPGTTLLALAAAVPPWATLWAERRLEHQGRLDGGWRLGPGGERPATGAERVLAAALARPVAAVALGVLALLALFGLALVVGPPFSGPQD